ncbi:MAG TPA: hypothetical protein VIL20_30285 [Sandaracinaceae bacterium]
MQVEDADRLVARLVPQRRSPLVAFAAVGALVLVLAGAVFVAWPREADPSRVLVVVRGCRDACADAIVEQLARTLEPGGFVLETPSAAPPDVNRAREQAAAQRAGHALVLELTVHEQRPPGPIDPAYAGVSITATLASLDDEPIVRTASPRIGAHRAQIAEAIEDAAVGAALGIADALHLALLERASVRAFADGRPVDEGHARRQGAIRKRLPATERAREALARMARSCEDAAAELASAGGRCLSDACAEEYAFAVTPDGSAALVHVETPAARMPIQVPFARAAMRVESEERLELVPLDGSPRRVLARAENYYTYPAFAAGRIVAIEQWPGGFGLVSIDVESAARVAIARFDARYAQSPRLSPDGTRVLYRVRARRSEPAQLAVSPVTPQPPVTFLGEARLATWVVLATGAEDPRALVAELVPLERLAAPEGSEGKPEGEDEEAEEGATEDDGDVRLALLDPDTARPVAWLDDDRYRVLAVAGVIDGRLAFTWTRNGVCGVGLWDPRASEATYAPTSQCVRDPRTDGRVIVGSADTDQVGDPSPRSDEEIVVVDPESGEWRALTANAIRERYPRAAGGRVVFDRVGEPLYRAFPRVATCWTELPRD